MPAKLDSPTRTAWARPKKTSYFNSRLQNVGMIHAGFPSFSGLGSEGRHVPTLWRLR